jgi:hypothetical protein
MQKFTYLYDFIDFAKANRKYPENTANNLKSALKIFEKELNPEELKSINMVEESVEEIFRSVTIANKNKSIISLNTYKARLLKVINDYKRYGADPSKIQKWVPRLRQGLGGQEKTKKSMPLPDKTDKEKIDLSTRINTPVENMHKIELSLESGSKAFLSIPKNMKRPDAEIIKSVIDSLTQK